MMKKTATFLSSISHCVLASLLFGLPAAATAGETKGIWISQNEIMALPTTGSYWQAVKNAADNIPAARGGHNSNHDVRTLAAALVAVRLNSSSYLQKTQKNLQAAIGTDQDGNSLSISRNLASYVIAADIIGYAEPNFKNWVRSMLTKSHNGGGCADNGKITVPKCSIIGKHEVRPNNHGAMAGASRVAADIYLGDSADLQRAAKIFHGYVGNRSVYKDFVYGEKSWQDNPSQPVGINPQGAVKNGLSIDGVQPDDQRRCGGFNATNPCKGSYTWEGLQGLLVQAYILHRAGFPAFEWENQALLRAYQWLYGPNDNPASGDDKFQLALVDFIYGTNFWNGSTVGSGKNMGWTDWTHGPGRGSSPVDETPPSPPTALRIN